ncbi:methyltransferase domain-containing protein [Marinivivus vitaminiproducens]|uniref:methyltransferase domain-containing protein n=1 Tax=Marinivivus vitaminiproducens TaxID=3035935 RepID=UPI0027A210BD|nr:methyltransferase domain-containing protein [Geminicoccaceae bacterium SCSIO 64248]
MTDATSVWDPAQYARFAAPRLRPAIDLLDRVPQVEYRRVRDLGCGSGQVTGLLAERFPDAEVVGIDTSDAMLASARQAVPTARFELCDVGAWRPDRDIDLIVSNAALHWLTRHEALMRSWLRLLQPGAVLAVQVPRNHEAPSHRAIAEVAARPAFCDKLADVHGIAPVRPVEAITTALMATGVTVDAWETTYVHVLDGEDPVLNWIKGAALRPYLTALGDEAPAFLEACGALLREAYPPLPDGRTLYAFKRAFVVATV